MIQSRHSIIEVHKTLNKKVDKKNISQNKKVDKKTFHRTRNFVK